MYLRRDELTRIVRAPAKLNVYLAVLGRRDDGFHDLQTLIVPIRLWDSLSFETRPPLHNGRPGPITLELRSCAGGSLPPTVDDLPPADGRNLVVRALELLRDRCGCGFGARVELTKRIPMQAGMGGGSSDAAAALRIANQAWGIGWTIHRLCELGAEIGSDVPYFLHGGAAICRGRGEQVEPVGGLGTLHFVVVKPPVGLNTADVYQAYDRQSTAADSASTVRLEALLGALRRGRTQEMGRWMTNHLEEAAARLTPWVARLKAVFSQLGCQGWQLSGSGSAYFAVCRHAQHARRVAARLRTRQLGRVYCLSSC